jgi:putative PIN family toxin of toxin-antitoxin system
MRLVVDTNLWVSYLLKPNSLIAPQIEIIQREETLLYSRATLEELSEVLSRAKFAKYVDREDVHTFIMAFIETGEHVTVSREIRACRDPRDDKFLELAVSGQADIIVTGDDDLLALHPFEDIPDLRPVLDTGIAMAFRTARECACAAAVIPSAGATTTA